MVRLITLWTGFIYIIQSFLSPVVLLVARLTMAKVFFSSGLTKIADWQSTVELFQFEYKTPFLSPFLAALLSTMVELSCPVLLTLGLVARLATLPMLFMTGVIQFTYMSHMDHLYWSILLGTILSFGSGAVSIDAIVKRWWNYSH